MAFDLAINNHGDLILAPNGDFEMVEGPDTVQQRIRVRLLGIRGEWLLDSDFGSALRDPLRHSMAQAAEEIELYVREALEPMEDIDVESVEIEESGPATLSVTVIYTVVDLDETDDGEFFQASVNLNLAG